MVASRYKIETTRRFDKRFAGLPIHLQKRIIGKICDVAETPYGQHNNVKKLQGREGFRLRVGDWRIIYRLEDGRLVMLVLEMDTRGDIY